ncbi:MAG: RloB family protein, partial [Gammaproteobacteria bacterium]|nr:RloB family protein [Gammaproteobacteria bacterium]
FWLIEAGLERGGPSHYTNVAVRPSREKQTGSTGLLTRLREELEYDPDLDEIYCVLDHDGRDTEIRKFAAALTAIDKETDSTQIQMILSAPCFEFWLLLHFEITDRPFAAGTHGAGCEDVIRRLERHLPRYKKNDSQVFEKCREHVNTAIGNSKKLKDTGLPSSQNHLPHTNVGHLIERLLKVSEEK